MQASFDAVQDHFGGLDAYLEALGIGSSARDQLHRNWLEEH